MCAARFCVDGVGQVMEIFIIRPKITNLPHVLYNQHSGQRALSLEPQVLNVEILMEKKPMTIK